MIVIDFDKNDQNVMNMEIIQRQPNFLVFEYKKIMSFIFFITSGINVILFGSKIYALKYEEIGFLKRLIYANLLTLLFYNLFYSFSSKDHWLTSFLDDFINASMMSLLLFLNLVLIDSQTEKIYTRSFGYDEFIKPKAVICFSIFVTLHFFMYTHSNRLHKYITEMEQLENSINTRSLLGEMDITDILCFFIFGIYGFISLRYTLEAFCQAQTKYKSTKSKQNYNLYNLIFVNDQQNILKEDLTVSRFASVFISIISLFLLALLFMPPRDEMLQFMDESGLINVYLTVLSYMLSPVDELDLIRFEGKRDAMKQQLQVYQNQLKKSKIIAGAPNKVPTKAKKSRNKKSPIAVYEQACDTDTESVPVINTSNNVDLMDIMTAHETGLEMKTIQKIRQEQSSEDEKSEEDLDSVPIDIFVETNQIEDNGCDVKI